MAADQKNNCTFCGSELVYWDTARPVKCVYCGSDFEANSSCTNGHYVCNACHSAGAVEVIQTFCDQTSETDPLQMAVTLMKHPAVKMHGPEHHFLVPAVLITAYYNLKGDPKTKRDKLREARKRSKNVLGGFCGFYGTCGAAMGTGIFISLITGATPLSTESWHLANLLTSRSLETIANHGGPRCCKRNTYLAIKTAVKFLQDHFNTHIPISGHLVCEFSELNQQCRAGDCPFHTA